MYYLNSKNNKYTDTGIDLIGSLNQNENNEIFFEGFQKCLEQFNKNNKNNKIKYISIENISDNFILLEKLTNLKKEIYQKNKNAYFLYNYIQTPINSLDILIIT